MELGEKVQLKSSRPELVFAVVGAAGTRLLELERQLKIELGHYGYTPVEVRLSRLLDGFAWAGRVTGGKAAQIRALQEKGDAVRGRAKDGAALARAGIRAIRLLRARVTGDENVPADAHAYIIHQLKHPEEVKLLRSVYGPSLVMIAGHAPRGLRLRHLAERLAQDELKPGQGKAFEADASAIIEVDENKGGDFGQNTRDTYPKADFFADLTAGGSVEVARFVELLFSHPFRTPTPDEYAMFQANAASLRSSDSSRQVGAAIVRVTGEADSVKSVDVTALGMNEVPRAGGGFYWDHDSPDCRDQALLHEKGQDRAAEIKLGALAELIGLMRDTGWFTDDTKQRTNNDLARSLNTKGTQFRGIGEFGRTIHAEMAALLDAARRGVAVEGHSIYVTTFPCHNCAKHIIGAGLRRVIYLEPYPKSRADYLHGEEVVLDSELPRGDDDRVVFVPFTGVAPRQYSHLFVMSERGKRNQEEWYAKRTELWPAHVGQYSQFASLVAEAEATKPLNNAVYEWDVTRANLPSGGTQ